MGRKMLAALAVMLSFALLGLQSATGHLRRDIQSEKTIAERLGYPANARLLIVHADDLGMARSINAATTKAFESGLVNSGSIMVPCPWLPDIAAYAKSHPEADLGLHLTLTSEWTTYRWGPVLSKDRVPTLLDKNGYLHLTETEAAANASVKQVEEEIQAQIDRARAFGIQPTHLDSHMGTLYQNKALFETLLRVARNNKLPTRVSREWFTSMEFLPSIVRSDDVVVEKIISIAPNVPAEGWAKFYMDEIKNIKPGLSEVIIHLAYDDEEMRAATADHPDWGAAWRQRDFQFFTSEAFRKLLQDNQIKLVTWREVGKALVGK